MSDFALEGDELKRHVKLAKKAPLPFAYCPGSSAPEDLFALHRKKPAEVMAKDLRANGEGSKIAFGMASVEGRVLSLTCDRVVPNIAKKLKKFLKLHKVSLNIQVLDAAGNLLESDIEELTDEDGFDAADDADEAGDAVAADEAAPEQAVPSAEAQELAQRYRQAQAAIAGHSDAAKLLKALATGAGLLRAGDLARATQVVEAVEAALGRDAGAGDTAAASSAEDSTRALTARLQALRGGVEAAPPDLAERLKKAFAMAVAALKAADTDRARQIVETLETALAGIGTQGAAAAVDAQGSIPVNAVALGKARVEWVSLRQSLKQELGRLQAAIVEECQDIPGYEGIASEVRVLFDHIAGLDTRLEDKLDEILGAAEGPKRVALKDEARAIIASYEEELAEEFFADLEDNGFMPLTVKAPAQAALNTIAQSLA